MANFDRFDSRTIIKAQFQTTTALSIGGLSSSEPTGSDLSVVKTPDGLPFIPGSSIKGVVRFQLERILRSLGQQYLWACDPLSDPCVDANKKTTLLNNAGKESKLKQERIFSQTIFQASCTVCRLFGSPWFSSRLSFKDAYLTNQEELPILTQIRDGVGIDRDLGAAKTGVKYDFEVVVPGTCFGVEILAENVEDWEIGLLLSILQMWQEGHLAIGGKTTRGPGWGELHDLVIHRVDQSGLLNYLINRTTQKVEPELFNQAFYTKISTRSENHA